MPAVRSGRGARHRSEVLAADLSRQNLPVAGFVRSISPKFQKHAGGTCGGVQIHITDRRRFDSYAAGVAFLQSVKRVAPDAFAWRAKPYEFVADIPAIDLLAGMISCVWRWIPALIRPSLLASGRKERAAFENGATGDVALLSENKAILKFLFFIE